MAYIEIVEGFNKGIFLKLDGDTLIGRAPNNALCLPDSRASREHALLKPDGDGYILQDLASANGTMVNGVLLRDTTSKELDDGDEIIVCSTRMVYHDTPLPLGRRPSENIPAPVGLQAEDNTRVMVKDGDNNASRGIAASRDPSDPSETEKRLFAIIHLATLAAEAPEEDALLNGVVDCIFEVFPTADRAIILLRDSKINEMVPVIGRERNPAKGNSDAFYAISRTIIQTVIEARKAILAADAMEEYDSHSSIADLSIRSMMCAPLIARKEILGIVHVDITSSGVQFSNDDLTVLTGIAAQSAIAVKNSTLFARVAKIANLLGGDEADSTSNDHSTDLLDGNDPQVTLKG